MTKKAAEQPTPQPVTGESTPEIPVDVQDAFCDCYSLAVGIDNLFYAVACSDEGLTPEGAHTPEIVSMHLVEQMKIVNGYFKRTEEGAGA